MRTEKLLGKIIFAEFGTVRDYPFLMGLQLGFDLNSCSIANGSQLCVNVGSECKWKDSDRSETIALYVDKINEVLTSAKANYVSELVGKPVEVTIVNNTFDSFRILTEVL